MDLKEILNIGKKKTIPPVRGGWGFGGGGQGIGFTFVKWFGDENSQTSLLTAIKDLALNPMTWVRAATSPVSFVTGDLLPLAKKLPIINSLPMMQDSPTKSKQRFGGRITLSPPIWGGGFSAWSGGLSGFMSAPSENKLITLYASAGVGTAMKQEIESRTVLLELPAGVTTVEGAFNDGTLTLDEGVEVLDDIASAPGAMDRVTKYLHAKAILDRTAGTSPTEDLKGIQDVSELYLTEVVENLYRESYEDWHGDKNPWNNNSNALPNSQGTNISSRVLTKLKDLGALSEDKLTVVEALNLGTPENPEAQENLTLAELNSHLNMTFRETEESFLQYDQSRYGDRHLLQNADSHFVSLDNVQCEHKMWLLGCGPGLGVSIRIFDTVIVMFELYAMAGVDLLSGAFQMLPIPHGTILIDKSEDGE